MLYFNKLLCELNENLIFKTEIRKAFGVGTNHTLNKKFGLTENAHAGILKVMPGNMEYHVEHHILSKFTVSFQLRQELKDNIRKKILMKSYQGHRHKIGLPVHGQRTHTNSKTAKKTLSQKLHFLEMKLNPAVSNNTIKKKIKKNLKKVQKKQEKKKK